MILFLGFVATLFLVGFALSRMWRQDGHEQYRARVRAIHDLENGNGPRDEEAW